MLMSITMTNLQQAFAGESQAYTTYRYFAKIARAEGHEEVAKHFEHTAEQELLHAHGHLELIVGKIDTKDAMDRAISGETHEYTLMYPTMKEQAIAEGNEAAAKEADEQIAESKEHAEEFKAVLAKAEKRFAALAKIEKRHAAAYQSKLETL
jgi:rubrerythrin